MKWTSWRNRIRVIADIFIVLFVGLVIARHLIRLASAGWIGLTWERYPATVSESTLERESQPTWFVRDPAFVRLTYTYTWNEKGYSGTYSTRFVPFFFATRDFARLYPTSTQLFVRVDSKHPVRSAFVRPSDAARRLAYTLLLTVGAAFFALDARARLSSASVIS